MNLDGLMSTVSAEVFSEEDQDKFFGLLSDL